MAVGPVPASSAASVSVLVRAQLATAIGDGAFFTCQAVYLVRHLGMSDTTAAATLSLAWAVGSVAGLLSGRVCDRTGPVPVAVGCCLAGAASLLALAVPGRYAVSLLVCVAYAAGQSGLDAARQAVVAGLVEGAGRARVSARLQVGTNAGLAAGAVLGGLALASDRLAAYRLVLAGDALSFLVCAVLLLRLRGPRPRGRADRGRPGVRAPGHGEQPRRRLGVIGDRPFLRLAALHAVLQVRMPLLSVALPLWIATRTAAPLWAASAAFALNTLVVLAFQLPVARSLTGVGGAARAVRRGACLLALSCLAFAGSASGGAASAVAVLLAAAAVQVAGELLQSAGGWSLSFRLAPEGRHGEYQGAFAAATALARATGPVLLVDLLLPAGPVGWVPVAAGFLVSGLLVPGAVRRCVVRRPTRHRTALPPVTVPAAHPAPG